LVEAKGNIGLFLVELEDGNVVLGEDVESEFIFESSSVKLVVGELPLRVEVSQELFLDGNTEGSDEEDRKENETKSTARFRNINLIPF